MKIFICVILATVCILFGGGFIGSSIHDFKEQNYYSFGFDIMMAITNVVLIVYYFFK